MHLALVKYSVMRLALFVIALVVLSLFGVGKSITLIVGAAAISLALSYLLLRRQRDEVAQALATRTHDRLDRKAAARASAGRSGPSDADIEDAADEAARAQRES